MAEWENSALQKCPKQPTTYFKYLDDIWGVRTDSKKEFQEFVDILNNHHKSIKLKPTLHESEVHFLDTTTFKRPTFPTTRKLDTKDYFKETDSRALLHKTSFHPKHTFRGILRSQLLRFHRICTRITDQNKATKTLFQALQKRGYSRSFLKTIRKRTFTPYRSQHKPQHHRKNKQKPSPLFPPLTQLSIRLSKRTNKQSKWWTNTNLTQPTKKPPNLQDQR